MSGEVGKVNHPLTHPLTHSLIISHSLFTSTPTTLPTHISILCPPTVLIIGAGGIGSSAIMYLAGAGVGSLTLVDFDIVEESNLHRQVIHDTTSAHSGTYKANSAAARVNALNPFISCDVVIEKLTRNNALDIMKRKNYDLVVDATDNFDARYLINDTCNIIGIPLVSGSAGE